MSQDEQAKPQVTIYSTTWCAFCKTEKQYLDHLGVTYVDHDVEADADAYNELTAKMNGRYQGVPVTEIAGELVLGFDRPKIDALLKANGLVTA